MNRAAMYTDEEVKIIEKYYPVGGGVLSSYKLKQIGSSRSPTSIHQKARKINVKTKRRTLPSFKKVPKFVERSIKKYHKKYSDLEIQAFLINVGYKIKIKQIEYLKHC